MEEKLLYISLALLFITSGAPANAQSEAAAAAAPAPEAEAAADDADVLYYDINRNLTLNCTLSSDDKTLTYVWKKNDVALEKVTELAGRHRLEAGGAVLAVTGRALEDDFGNYSCALGGERRAWDVRGRPVARLPENTNVVEGQKLKLVCKVVGKPYPAVTWTYNASEEGLGGAALEAGARGGRLRLEASEQGVPGGALLLDAAERADAGRYGCRAGAGPADHTLLRVKDMYAALWPFLGICAEVFVLCAIILVYEKRRTKPELDDSDTDNHDQKKS